MKVIVVANLDGTGIEVLRFTEKIDKKVIQVKVGINIIIYIGIDFL